MPQRGSTSFSSRIMRFISRGHNQAQGRYLRQKSGDFQKHMSKNPKKDEQAENGMMKKDENHKTDNSRKTRKVSMVHRKSQKGDTNLSAAATVRDKGNKKEDNKQHKSKQASDVKDGDHMKKLLQLSRSMTDVISQSLDTMHILANDVMATAQGMRSLVAAQRGRRLSGSSRVSERLSLLFSPSQIQRERFSKGRNGELNKQIVEIKVVFIHISDIDTVNQQFEAEVYIQARWAEKKFAGFSEAKLAKIEFYDCTDPHLKILNVVGDLDREKTSMVLRYEPESLSPVLVYMWHIRGIFRERMELQHFPFDVQELSMVISSDLPIDQVELAGDFFRASSVNRAALQTNQDWANYRHVEITRDVSTQEMESTRKYSVLVVAARVKRRLGFYFWNVVLIVLLIEAMTLVFLAVDPAATTRLVLSITLFLTAVAFKLVVKTTLPDISYLTYLDLYIIFVMTYLFLWAGTNALMCHLAKYRDRQKVLEYDEIAQSCLIGFLVLFHLLFLIYIQVTALSRRRQMNKLDLKYSLAKAARHPHVAKILNQEPVNEGHAQNKA